jgi:chitodextrinase
MKCKLLLVALIATSSAAFAQNKSSLWNGTTKKSTMVPLEAKMQLPENKLFDLNLANLRTNLTNAPARMANSKSNTILSLPNADGSLERYSIYENSTMDPALAARYPEIKSYVGIGIDTPTATAYFSVSPLGFKSMVLAPDKSAVFIEPISADLGTYTVYKKSDKNQSLSKLDCSVLDVLAPQIDESTLRPNADDGTLRTFRLAVSVTGEYTAYFGGTKALALAAINNTMTRVNGVFEKDFGTRMVLIANNDLVIYTSGSSDPYSAAATGSGGAWNAEVQNTLTNVIGNAAYDIGHLFGASGGGGNAGCIGCICVNDTSSTTDKNKGSGFTSPYDGIPSGDNFDIDYVAHEMGHQFGANHTFSMSNEGTGANMEPGSGSTIMGYAGITSQDVQPHSDAYFHAISIQQVTNNIKGKTCQTNTATGNAVPTADAGLNYTIPKSTPFMLTGSGTDANGDALTYNWEQFDNAASNATGVNSAASATRTSGPTFRSYNSSTSPVRYFPNMSRVLAGATTTSGTEITVEAVPSVARTMNFRLTVRDNRAGGPANNSDDTVITVNATAGPFLVSSPNTAVSYVGGSTQTVTWAIAGTTANGVNCANVDILISTNGGSTWSTLLAATPNDGTQAVTIPNIAGTSNRIMVKGTNHVFFDVSNTNFTITAGSTDTIAPTAPTLAASGTTQTTTNLSWSGATDNVAVTGYDVYKDGALLGSTASTSYAVSGLTASTTFAFTVRAKDAAGNASVSSNTASVTTLTPTPDSTAPTAPTLSASGTTTTTTNLSWSGATDNVAVTGYDVYSNSTFLGSTSATTYAVSGLTAATAYTFNVRAKDAAGNVSPNSNTVSVTTLTNTVSYCASQGNSTADERIGRVVFGTINNPSTGTAGYENFTALSTNVNRSSAYTITITPTWTGTVYSEGYAVFIDYNQDGDFSDAGETVWTKARSKTTPVTGSITIPASALLGSTRMRVSMKYNATPTACEAFPYGQVEDYTINIGTSGRVEETSNTRISFNVYPNPVKGDILNISNLETPSTYRIVNMMGQELGSGKIENDAIYVGSLAKGTFLIEVSNGTTSTTKRFIKE